MRVWPDVVEHATFLHDIRPVLHVRGTFLVHRQHGQFGIRRRVGTVDHLRNRRQHRRHVRLHVRRRIEDFIAIPVELADFLARPVARVRRRRQRVTLRVQFFNGRVRHRLIQRVPFLRRVAQVPFQANAHQLVVVARHQQELVPIFAFELVGNGRSVAADELVALPGLVEHFRGIFVVTKQAGGMIGDEHEIELVVANALSIIGLLGTDCAKGV